MTLSQVIVYANQIAKQRLGYQAISLTNYDNDLEPQIAAGSKVEIGGALFEAVSDENISGWAGISNSSDVYIKLIVSGATATAEFTDTPPTWSTSKQGFYNGSDRYIVQLYKDASGNYTDKWLYKPTNRVTDRVDTDGIAAAAITETKIAEDAVKSAKIDKSSSTTGGGSLSPGQTWTPPAGIYMITITSGIVYLDIYASGGWRRSEDEWPGGCFITDGVHSRIFAYNSINYYYVKLP